MNSDFFQLILSMSLSGSILALMLFALRPFVKERFSKAWQYYIWLVVILRLLVPYSPENSLVGNLFGRIETARTGPAAHLAENAPAAGMKENIVDADTPDGSIISQQTEENTPDFFDYLWLVWASGALFFLTVKAVQYKNFMDYARAGAREVKEQETVDLFEAVKKELGIKRKILLYQSKGIKSPMLVGLLKPAIILPDHSLSSNHLNYVFRHELIHFKRRDIGYKWLVQLTVCVHWFNPLMYILSRQVNSLCEFSCDEAVARELDTAGKMEYGDTLLCAVAFDAVYKSHIISMTLCEDKKFLKERLGAIMKAEKKSRKNKTLSVVLMAVLCCTAVWLGVFSAERPAGGYGESSLDYSAVTPSPDSSAPEGTYPDKDAFLNSAEGHSFQVTAWKFTKAYLSGDTDTMKSFLLDPESKNHDDNNENRFDEVEFLILKLSPQNIRADSVTAEYEFLLKGEDTYQYLYFEMKKVDGEWKVEYYGLQM